MADVTIALNRFGLGARPGPLPTDARRWLLDQFDRYDPRPPRIAQLPGRVAAANAVSAYYDAARMDRARRPGTATPEPAPTPEPMMTPAASAADPRRDARQALQAFYVDGIQARADTAVVGTTPFIDRLVHFWSNHFAISAEKPPVTALAASFEFDAVRPHVLGHFGDMLGAVERHPAMLTYLDQAQSVGPNSRVGLRAAAAGRQRGLNENLAREILELHTLGVRTGYTQADVTEFARALTGWGASGLARRPAARMPREGEPGAFAFTPALHEPGTRAILGWSFDQPGEAQGAAVLQLLAAHPSTARHICTKLARHFAGDTPPPALVARLEGAFLKSGGDLPTLYRTLIDSPEPWTPAAAKFKTPWEWSISAARALGSDAFVTPNAANFVTQLGQRVWRPGSPAGHDDIAASWAGPDAVMRRVEAAARLSGRLRDRRDASRFAATAFGAPPTGVTAQAISRAESDAQGIALVLVAPEFMRR